MDPQHELQPVEYAGFWKRFGAYIIDSIVIWIVLWIISIPLGVPVVGHTPTPPGTNDIIFGVLGVIITWLYFALMESSQKQATLGKMAIGIIVTDEVGRRVSFARATGRYFSKIISGIILMIGYLMAGWTQKKQALHDMIARTLVINR